MDRPRVITCNQASVDGRLTLAPEVLLLHGDERWNQLAGRSDLYAWIRTVHDPDALLEGSGSFVPSDAGPVPHPPYGGDASRLYEHFLPAELIEQSGRRWMAVVDGRGRVRFGFTEWPDPDWAGWHVLVLTSRAVAATGGGRLGGALLRAGLVDEVDVDFLPAVIGGRGTPALFDAPPLRPDETPTRLELLAHEITGDGHLRLRYRILPDDRPAFTHDDQRGERRTS